MQRVIFVHIPRTAGTSIKKCMQQDEDHFLLKRSWIPVTAENTKKFILLSHTPITCLIKHAILDEDMWNNSFKFVFVRNPWDRLVSVWKFYKGCRRQKDYSTRFLESFSIFFEKVIVNKKWIPPLGLHIHRPNFQHVLPQTNWLDKDIDFIGRFENLADDWKTICELIKMKYNVLKKTNTTKHLHYSTYYTPKMVDQTAFFYAEDIERFNYKFEDKNGE